MRIRLLLAPAMAAVLVAACSDRTPVSAPAVEGPAAPLAGLARIECRAEVTGRTLTCGASVGGDVRGDIYGGQGAYVKLTSTNVGYDRTSETFSASLTVQNLLAYPLGTADGATPDSGGVKVFFNTGPTVTGGTGNVSVQNADGVGVFTATGQPFFKYPGMLQPSQTSPGKTWQFHVDSTVTTFGFTLYVQAAEAASAFRVVAPQPGDSVSTDSVTVMVNAVAPPGVNYITAAIGARSTYLSYDAGIQRWTGKLNLVGLAYGPQTLRVKALAPGDSTVELVSFVYTGAPLLGLSLPVEGTVARPQLRVAGSCVDAGGCTSVRGTIGNTTLFTTSGATFDVSVSLSAYEGTTQTLTVTADDGAGNSATESRTVFVESTSRWSEVAALGTRVLAVGPTRVLYKDSVSANSVTIRIRDLGSGADSLVIADARNWAVPSAYVTPVGAIFTLMQGDYGDAEIVEFRNGAVRRGVGLAWLGLLDVKDRWVAWLKEAAFATPSLPTLFQRDVVGDSTRSFLAGGAKTRVFGNLAIPRVAPNGDVVFTDTTGAVRRYRSGTLTQISTGVELQEVAKSDGTLIVYRKADKIMLYDGTSETPLTPAGAPPFFEVVNGRVAFVSFGTNGSRQLFVRRQDGSVVQVSQGTGDVIPVGLGDGGEVVYTQGGRRYYAAPPWSTPVDIGTNWEDVEHLLPINIQPRVRFYGTDAYTWLGRSGFRIVP